MEVLQLEGISTTGESGLQDHLSRLMRLLLEVSTVNSERNLCQYGRQSYSSPILQTECTNPTRWLSMKSISADLEPCNHT